MKKIIYKGLVSLFAVGALTACSSDYLETEPVTSIPEALVYNTLEGVDGATNGMYQLMYMSNEVFGGGAQRMFNGEPWINWYHGEVPGSDYYTLFWASAAIYNQYVVNMEGMDVEDYWFCQPAWIYYYTMINQANNILYGIDRLDAEESVRNSYKAQALVMRAWGYYRLLTIYGPRYADMGDMSQLVLVKRIADKNTGGSPLVSVREIADLIKSDLDTGIALLEQTNFQRVQPQQVDAQVAKGIYARFALWMNDFPTAKKMAKEARQGHPIMSKDQYLSGFVYANSEYIWYFAPTDMIPVGYSGAAWTTGCNGPYMEAWDYGAGAINYDLYRLMDEKDIRRALFWTPDKMRSPEVNQKNFKDENWWNLKYVNSGNMDISNKVPGFYTQMRKYAVSKNLAGGRNPSLPAAYAHYGNSTAATNLVVPFGAHFKFWGWSQYGTCDVLLMRAAEMLLIEAEAAYESSDVATAQSCLTELNKQRIEGYGSCTTTGEALRDEIRLARRIELWGEGHCWFDLKRWNLPMTRRPWIEGDPTSNNIPETSAVTVEPTQFHGWRFAMPRAEWLYNDKVNQGDNWKMEAEAPASVAPLHP